MTTGATPTPMSAGGATASANPKTVLITGVSRGLGKALTLELAKRGHVIIGCFRTSDKLSSLQSQLAVASENKGNCDKHIIMTIDVRSDSSVEVFARVVAEKKVVTDVIGLST